MLSVLQCDKSKYVCASLLILNSARELKWEHFKEAEAEWVSK